VGTSLTLQGMPYQRFQQFVGENPHVRFFDSRERGYVGVEMAPATWRTDLRTVSSVAAPRATARTLRSFVVETARRAPRRLDGGWGWHQRSWRQTHAPGGLIAALKRHLSMLCVRGSDGAALR
jgi:hypothetical protein